MTDVQNDALLASESEEAMGSAVAAVGRPLPRRDSVEKVMGRAQFTGDIRPAGLLHAALVTSPVPKGRIDQVRQRQRAPRRASTR